ncbi:MAG TPA: Fic family protein [Candidatus Dormibacteraeota bacterium]
MASQVRRRWQPTLASGLPRRDRLGCDFEAYLPDRLSGRKFVFRGDVAADIADAETAVQRLDLEATSLVDSEGLARLLLRAEAVASSRIEGLEVGGRRLLRAEAARAAGDPGHDITAEEILGNVNAMSWAIGTLGGGEPLRVEDLLEVHRRLVAGTRLEDQGGVIRDRQNWIGGSSYNPCQAAFVPPPPEEVPGLLEDLCAFCNQDHLPAIAQAAIAHAQFETIHPFSDGNGRTGRALIHVILRQRGLVSRVLPPISLVLATWSEDYVNGLTRTRYLGDPDQAQAREGLDDWISLFATATRRAVDDARSYEDTVRGLQVTWRARIRGVRRGSAVDLLLNLLPGTPVLTVAGAASMIGRSYQATNAAIGQLAEAGILRQVRAGSRNRAFEAAELIDAFGDLERRLASPDGDTRVAPPARPVPQRRP